MTTAKNWDEIRAKRAMRPDDVERQAAARARLAAEDQAYFEGLANVRKARSLTQALLAANMKMPQPSISRLERQTDLYLSTLRRYIEAMGGKLEIHAVFPDKDVEIGFDDLQSVDREHPDFEEPETHRHGPKRHISGLKKAAAKTR
ncbi:XRE family transcriptional regulator [Klenkia sp. PcliD-1-E]|uniref:XRE family transcriptional regulator n=1 Tax=Klenkia sp. PcliD-1-E TaxID=2954492 RepID=UPI002096E4C2|nr:XRE family transcriptional regulator [Klenkia sp. PcliD-1-E]MCO7220399.1 helix-turn-helix domain-containing protein [Klenkia sp. PcliD-1-E]